MTTPRPEAVGLEIDIQSIDNVDPILHEMAWIQNEIDRLDAIAREKIDAITKEHNAKYFVTIDGEQVGMGERYEKLEEALENWAIDNVKPHLPKGKKSIDMAHGTIGLRRLPLIVEFGPKMDESKVLKKNDKEAEGIVAAIKQWSSKKLKTIGCLVGDVLKIKVTPNTAGVKKALDEKKITRPQIRKLGLKVRDPIDVPVITPSEPTVSNESTK